MEDQKYTNLSAIMRTALVVVLFLLQLGVVIIISTILDRYSVMLYSILDIAAIIFAIALLEDNKEATFKIAWLIIVLIAPVLGILLYVMWGRGTATSRERAYRYRAFSRMEEEVIPNARTQAEIERLFPERNRISRYLDFHSFPAYQNTITQYIPQGEFFFDELFRDMEQAEKFIFLEYFIISPGKIWAQMLDIMRRKAASGVEVRLLYDDGGCLFHISRRLRKEMMEQGIKVSVFAPVNRHVSELYLNYRNHQKIAVIDGNIGYVGGANIADEYANLIRKHGHWKDACLRLEGEAVWGLTSTFISMWDLSMREVSNAYSQYRPTNLLQAESFCHPFSDNPANNPDNPAHDVYRQLIAGATRYCYISSPYLVVDTMMLDALRVAAHSGVDIRIITPKIPDHWYVHLVTRSYYGELIRNGVRIYEYTPGFIHSKLLITDDEAAVVGSINMDYRSFYLHYENAVYLLGDPSVTDIRDDMLSTMDMSEEITYEQWNKRPFWMKALEIPLRLFAPLM